MTKRIILCVFLVLLIFVTTACKKGEAVATPLPIDTVTSIPTIIPTDTPVPTSTEASLPSPTPTITETATQTLTPIPTTTPTMTPFPTLDYEVEFPGLDTTGMTIEAQQRAILGIFYIAMLEEYAWYDKYDLPPNPNYNGFPSLEEIFAEDGYLRRLDLPLFCRYYPYIRIVYLPAFPADFSYNLDYSFVEVQTLVGIDCSTIDISMFPAPENP